jgi:diadenosine tetraphosphatase ApaH/serine/threonine PP2A family protein phosphatase
LTAEQRAWLRDLPYQAKLGFHATVVHASLDTPGGWAYIFDSLTAAACMNYQITQMCFFGHTHVPLAFEKDGGVQGDFYKEVRPQAGRKYLVNVGSVGQPRDGDPRAAFVVFTPSSRHVEIHRVEYDIEACQRKIRDAGLPDRLADRLALGR